MSDYTNSIGVKVIRHARKAYSVVLVDTEREKEFIVAQGESEREARKNASSVLGSAAIELQVHEIRKAVDDGG
jgi:hypothetical protein